MKVAVAVKQVPARDSQLKIDAVAVRLDESNLTFEINEPDAYALEAALQLKEKQGGEVVVFCAGPDRVSSTIREALAKGADRAVHVRADNLNACDALGVARLLAAAIAAEQPDLVLTGLQSDDLGYGQTGVILAELLDRPHATIIMSIDVAEGALKVKRELEGGWFQFVEMPLPAVLTIQSGINKLRYATLIGIKKAKTKEVKQVTAADLGVAAPQPRVELVSLQAPRKTKQTEMLEGDPAEVAARLVEKLKHEVRVL